MSQRYIATGTVKAVTDTQSFPSGFMKRELVLELPDAKYPQTVAFTFTRERVNELDRFTAGDRVTVTFDIRGREYNGRHYIDLHAWKIEPAEDDSGFRHLQASVPSSPAPSPAAPSSAPAGGPMPPPQAPQPAGGVDQAELDELPF